MQRRIWALLLAVCVACAIGGCRGGDDEKADNGKTAGKTSTKVGDMGPTGEVIPLPANGGKTAKEDGDGGDGGDRPDKISTVLGDRPIPKTQTQLMGSIRAGDIEAVKAALAVNPDWVDKKDKRGQTPLLDAIENGRNDIALLLLSRRADPKLEGPGDVPPLHLAASKGLDDVIESLIKESKVDVNTLGPGDDTALHVAAEAGQLSAVQILLGMGATIEAKDKAGLRPLHKAVASQDYETVNWLLKHKAYANARANDGSTPMSIAKAKGDKVVIGLLEVYRATVEGVPAELEPPKEEYMP